MSEYINYEELEKTNSITETDTMLIQQDGTAKQLKVETALNNKITTEISKIVANAPEDFDTLKEMSDWITEHEDDATAMNTAILENKNNITTLTTELKKKQTDLKKTRFMAQRNNNSNKYCLICTFEFTTETSFSSPLVIEGFLGSNSTAKSNGLFKMLINPRNKVTNSFFMQGYIYNSYSLEFTDIVVTKDENNKCYVYADFIQSYGLIDIEIKTTLGLYIVNTQKTLLSEMQGTEITRLSTAQNVINFTSLQNRITSLETALNITNGSNVEDI